MELWMVLGGIAVVAFVVMTVKSDAEKNAFIDAMALMEQKEQQRQWMEMMMKFQNDERDDNGKRSR